MNSSSPIDSNLTANVSYLSSELLAQQKGQQPTVIWFTGLSGAGKSTIASLLQKKFYLSGHHVCVLDGDQLRKGINRDLSFADEDRAESVRRAGEMAKLMAESGLIVLSALISPFARDRLSVKELLGEIHFMEVYLHAPIDVLVSRDPKGLYEKALNGKIGDFTGIDSRYEPPESPDLSFDTSKVSAGEVVQAILAQYFFKSDTSGIIA